MYVTLVRLTDERISGDSTPPEDLKAACVEAIYNLVKYSTLPVIEEALKEEMFIKALGHSISVFLNMGLNEKSNSLKISSFKVLEVILIRSHSLVESKKISYETIAGIYIAFLPGIAMTTMKLLESDDKHPQGLLICSLNVYTLYITLSLPIEVKNDLTSTNTLTNLKTVTIRIIDAVIHHRSLNVKLTILSMVKCIFEKTCYKLLDHLDDVLLKVPLTYSMDSKDDTLKNNAMTFLCDLTTWNDGKHFHRICDIIKDKAITILLNGPNSVDIDTESTYMGNIQLLSAIFTLMSKYNVFNGFICTPCHRNRLMYFLSTYSTLEQVNPTESTFDGKVKFKILSTTSDYNVYEAFSNLLTIIGLNCSVEILIDFIVDYLQSTNYEANSLFVCNLIVKSTITSQGSIEFEKNNVTNGSSIDKLERLSRYYFENCTQVVEDTISSVGSSSSISSSSSCTFTSSNSTSTSSNTNTASSISKFKSSNLIATSGSSASSSSTGLSCKSFYKIYFGLQGLLSCLVESKTVVTTKKYFNPLNKEEEITQFVLTLLRVQSLSHKFMVTKTITDMSRSVLLNFARVNYVNSIEKLVEKHLPGVIKRVEDEVSINPYIDVSPLIYVISSYSYWENVSLYKCLVDRLLELLDSNYTQDGSNLLKALLVLAKWIKEKKEEKINVTAVETEAKNKKMMKKEKVIHQNCKCSQEFTCTCCKSKDLPKKIESTSSSPGFDQLYYSRSDFNEDEFRTNWRKFLLEWYKSEYYEDDEEGEMLHCSNTQGLGKEKEIEAESELDEEEKDFRTSGRVTSIDALMTKDILTRCVNLLGTPEARDRIVNLEVIEITSIILGLSQGEEEENLLLPLVHKAWQQLVIRLTDEASVARVALRVLITLSSICGDFIKDRVVSQVIPKIVYFLKAHVEDGSRKENKTFHRFTIVFQYQLEALTNIGKLVYNLKIFGKDLWPLIEIILKYNSNNQLNQLQLAAKEAIDQIDMIDSDAVWFYREYNKCL